MTNTWKTTPRTVHFPYLTIGVLANVYVTVIETFVQSGSLANMGIRDTDPDTGETISVPCSGFTIPNFLPPPMQHIEEYASCLPQSVASLMTKSIEWVCPGWGTLRCERYSEYSKSYRSFRMPRDSVSIGQTRVEIWIKHCSVISL